MLIILLSVNLRLLQHLDLTVGCICYANRGAWLLRCARDHEVNAYWYARGFSAISEQPEQKVCALVVLFKHALRNAIIPVVSLAAVQLGLCSAAQGQFFMDGISCVGSSPAMIFQRFRAYFGIFAILYCSTFLADLLNAWLDPRIRIS